MNALIRGSSSSSSSMCCRPECCGSIAKHLPVKLSRHSRCLVVPYAAGQQQHDSQQVSSYKNMMQQYRSLVPAQPAEQQNARRGTSSNTKNKSTKVTPRLKPTKQSFASPVDLRETKATAAAAAAARTVKITENRTDGSSAKSSTKISRISEAQFPDQGSQLSSSQKSGGSNSSKESFQKKDGAASRMKQPAIPAAWRLSSNGKGFGGGAGNTTVAAPAAENSAQGSPHSPVVRVFRFGLTAAAVSKAIEACNWQGRVVSVDNIKQADLLLAIKCTPGGEHLKLGQGKKAASNAGIPFVVVGRKMSPQSFRRALITFVEPHSQEAAQLAAAAALAEAKEAENKAVADAFFRSAAAWKRAAAQ